MTDSTRTAFFSKGYIFAIAFGICTMIATTYFTFNDLWKALLFWGSLGVMLVISIWHVRDWWIDKINSEKGNKEMDDKTSKTEDKKINDTKIPAPTFYPDLST